MRPSQTWGDKLPKVGEAQHRLPGQAHISRPETERKWGTALVMAEERLSCQDEQMTEKKVQTQGAVFWFLWRGRSDPQLSLLGSTAGFRVPFPTKNHSNRNSWHFYCVKHRLGFEQQKESHSWPTALLNIVWQRGSRADDDWGSLLSPRSQEGWERTRTQKSWLSGLIT